MRAKTAIGLPMQIDRLQRRSCRGFTLIEVLVALTIVSIALIALSQAGGRAVDTQFQLEQRSVALWIASNRLAEIELNQPISPGTRSGQLQMAERDWRWQADIVLAPGNQLWRADVRVYDSNDALILTHSGFLAR